MHPYSNVIILGCGRSGTSIFGELFQHLPFYKYYSEPPFEEVMEFDFHMPIAIKVPRGTKAYPADPGLSFPLAALLKVMPRPKIYWQVRHPLDTICSLKIGISRNWGHHPQPPDWKEWLKEPLIKRCAHHWNYLNTVGYQQIRHLAEINRFEEMVLDPLSFTKKVCSDVGLDYSKYSQEIASWTNRVHNTNHPHFVEAETSRPYSTKDHKTKVERWKENMSQEELEMVKPMVAETALTFGYDVGECVLSHR